MGSQTQDWFINKCECCQYFGGSKHANQAWGYYHDVDCEKGISSTVGKGCQSFYPIRLGCQADCYLSNGSFPSSDCTHHNIEIMRGSKPCYAYAKKDYESEPKKGCFISTAVCYSQNLPDDCDELTTLRYFRDHHLLNDVNTAHLVQTYYQTSPQLIHKLNENDKLGTYLYQNFIVDIVQMIKDKADKQEIIKKYQQMFDYLKNF